MMEQNTRRAQLAGVGKRGLPHHVAAIVIMTMPWWPWRSGSGGSSGSTDNTNTTESRALGVGIPRQHSGPGRARRCESMHAGGWAAPRATEHIRPARGARSSSRPPAEGRHLVKPPSWDEQHVTAAQLRPQPPSRRRPTTALPPRPPPAAEKERKASGEVAAAGRGWIAEVGGPGHRGQVELREVWLAAVQRRPCRGWPSLT